MDHLVEELLAKMSLEEKVGQMTQLTIDMIAEGKAYKLDFPLKINADKLHEVVVTYKIGSILNVGPLAHTCDRWREIMKLIAEKAEQTPLKIPVLYGIDSIHGASYVMGATLFPQQLGLASTWNLELAERMGEVSAYETKAAGMPWAFSPVLDMGRNPVWPRLWETFGEDVHLTTALGQAVVKGMQGNEIGETHKVAACLKHFLGYGLPLSGKDRTPAYIPERQLQEYHVPPFAKVIADGAATIMVNSGEINGIPVHANPAILTQLLRKQLGFKGVVVTDWEDIQYLHTRHRIAKDQKEAVRLAILAGIDMSMVALDFSFNKYLLELVQEGTISEDRIDRSVRRILKLKLDLGLFDQMVEPSEKYPDFAGANFKKASLTAAQESLVLCKNEEKVLPLKAGQKILVTGPTAHSLRSQNGGWTYSWQGELTDEQDLPFPTVLDALRNELGTDNVVFSEGATFSESVNLPETLEAAAAVDAIVVCLGETSYCEFYGNIDDLYLDQAQGDLVEALAKTGKPIIVVLLEGRPRLISKWIDLTQAVLVGFYPGNEGGQAVADVLLGSCNPSGKLPVTYPKYPNGLSTYDYKSAENLDLQDVKGGFNPQFEFGHGLSYTTFSYKKLKLAQQEVEKGQALEVQVEVKNTGKRAGKEVVQLYLRDLYASVTPSIKRLKGFQKVSLAAGESRVVRFTITEAEMAFVGIDNKWVIEPGTFEVQIADLKAQFDLVATPTFVTHSS